MKANSRELLLADGGRAGERPGRRRRRRVLGAGAAEGNGDETVERKAKGFEMGYIVFVVVPLVCIALVVGSFGVKSPTAKALMFFLPLLVLALLGLAWCVLAQFAGIDG